MIERQKEEEEGGPGYPPGYRPQIGPDGRPMGPEGMRMMGPRGPGPIGPDGRPMGPEGMRMPIGPDGRPMGPPIGPDGRPMGPGGPRMMMGPNGPMPMPPPNHPIMMEMQALHQHLQGLYQQPQNPQLQQKVNLKFFLFYSFINFCLHFRSGSCRVGCGRCRGSWPSSTGRPPA